MSTVSPVASRKSTPRQSSLLASRFARTYWNMLAGGLSAAGGARLDLGQSDASFARHHRPHLASLHGAQESGHHLGVEAAAGQLGDGVDGILEVPGLLIRPGGGDRV